MLQQHCAQWEVWESLYAGGARQFAPWDHVVSFLFRFAPKDRAPKEISILEVCCGSAANLLFAAQRGFTVTGVDFSESAISAARSFFAAHNLTCDLRVADVCSLPFADCSFDMVIDRAGLTYCPPDTIDTACSEVFRVLKHGGAFFFNPYSDRSSSAASGLESTGNLAAVGGFRTAIDVGSVKNTGGVNFFSSTQVQQLIIPHGGTISQMQHMEWMDMKDPLRSMHAEWRIVAEKECK